MLLTVDASGNWYIYTNGSQTANGTGLAAPSSNNNNWTLGCEMASNNNPTTSDDVDCCEWVLYDRALSADEAGAIGDGASPLLMPDGLLFYVPGVDASGYEATGKTVTVNGSPTKIEHPKIIRPSAKLLQFPPAAGGGPTSITCTAGTITLTGQAATINAATSIESTAGSVLLTGQSATINAASGVQATAGSVLLTPQQAAVNASNSIETTAGSILLTGQQASVSTASDTNITATAGSVILTGQQAGINAATGVTATAGSILLTGQQATVATGTLINATAGTIALTGQAATTSYDVGVSTTAGTVTLTGQQATVTATVPSVLIDGANTKVISSNYGSVRLYKAASGYYTL